MLQKLVGAHLPLLPGSKSSNVPWLSREGGTHDALPVGMKFLLFIAGGVTGAYGLNVLAGAKYVPQETEGVLLLLIAAVLFVGGAIVRAVDQLAPKAEPQAAGPTETEHERQVREVAARLIPASPNP